MKYTKTIELWAPGVQTAITQGHLKIQCGQWVSCGDMEKKSRFVSERNGVFNVVHYPVKSKKFAGRAALHALSKTPIENGEARRAAVLAIIGSL